MKEFKGLMGELIRSTNDLEQDIKKCEEKKDDLRALVLKGRYFDSIEQVEDLCNRYRKMASGTENKEYPSA